MRLRYSLHKAIFSSIGSSERSIMWELYKGFPVALKNSSPASRRPSIHGRRFFAQWSVFKITVAPYSSASSWMCLAPATAPAIAACWFSLLKPFPALNCAPPLENWIITGLFNSAAVSKTVLMELLPITFTAGSANLFALAYSKISCTCRPVATPLGKLDFIFLVSSQQK